MSKEDIQKQAKQTIVCRLENTLKGDAFLIKENPTLTAEERMERMRIIEQYTRYIRDFDKNTRLLAEYEELKNRTIDDGR